MAVVFDSGRKRGGYTLGYGGGSVRRKKDDQNRVVEFIGNSASDVKDLVGGLFTGPVELYRAVSSGHGKDAFKAILNQIEEGAVGQLAQGNFKKAGREAWENPVNTALDLAAVGEIAAAPFTGGASLLLTGSTVGARGGRALEALAGLRKVTPDEAAKIPKDLLRTNKHSKQQYARLTRDWRYHGKPLDADIAPEVLPRNIFNRYRKVARMKARETVAPGSVARKITRAAERGSFRETAQTAMTLSSKFDDQLDKLSAREQGLIHVALSTAAPDPHVALKLFREETERRIAKHGLTDELREKQLLYGKESEKVLRDALKKPEFAAATNTARRMSNEGALMQASDARVSGGPEKMLESLMREGKLLGAVDAPADGKAIRTHSDPGDKLKAEIDWTEKRKPDTYKKNTGKNFDAGKDVTDPRIYRHQMMTAAERNRTAPAVVKAFNLAVARPADKLSKDMKPVTAAMADHIEGLRKVIHKMPSELQETQQAQAILRAAQKMDELADGEVLALPKFAYSRILGHMQSTSNLANRFSPLSKFDSATNVWRAAVLNLRPAWIANNVIGSLVLLGIAHGPEGLYHAARSTKIGKRDGLIPVGLKPSKSGELIGQYAPHMEMSGFAEANAAHIFGKVDPKSKLGKILRSPLTGAEKMGAINSALESPARRGAWLTEVNKAARIIKKNARNSGVPISHDQAVAAVLADARTLDRVTESAISDMVDFSSLGDFEKQFVRRVIPFYSWLRGISKRAVRLYLEQPTKARMLGALSQYGLDANQEGELGGMPSFLRGAIDLGEGSDSGHRKILTTQGMNPFATVGDVAGQIETTLGGKRTFGGENPLSQANPFVRAPIEAFTNRDLFYGSPLHHDDSGTFIGDYFKQLVGGTPQVAAYRKLKQAGTPDASQRMFTPSAADVFANYMGLPRKDVNRAVARLRAREEKFGPTELG